MEAKNLRVGNLVDWINRGGLVHLPANKPIKVFEISTFKILAYDPNKNPSTIERMPVYTPEIATPNTSTQ